MDGGDLALLGQSENLIGSGMELESRVDDSKLVGAGVVEVKGGEQQVEMPLVAGSEILPAVAASVASPVMGQVMITPVVVEDQMMEKKKRGRPSRSYVPKLPAPKMIKEEEEDVCFICFDGGSLVLCDRKGCPKAYHPACIKRDEKFFTSKTRWDCGWHICSVCEKPSLHFCYTCTYSLCKKCTKNSEYVSVRGNRGFCSICMKIIMMIENKDAENKESIQVDFDDKTSWEYLFKVYWIVLKTKWSLTLDELMEAKNPFKGVVGTKFKPKLREKDIAAVGGVPLPTLPTSGENSEQKSLPEQNQVPDAVSPEKRSSEKRKISDGCMDWASQELLEFVAHMRNGDMSVLSQFDVQALLMEYIKVNNLRNPQQKSQIICDLRLKTLFGKSRVGHIEMLKLLEYHYLITDDTEKNAVIPAGIVGSGSHVAIDNSNHCVSNQSKKQKTRKKGEEKASQVNLDEYAAIDNHNVKLIFLRRSMMENLLDQVEKFHEKVIGSIVRIRVSTNDQKQDIYRLVQVVGTSKAAESYKIGEKTTDILLEVLNLDKKETMSIVAMSNQDFSEEECRRLRQSIKWGLVKRMTVGEIQTKAMALQALRFDDWLVAEILRLSHLRDRANEKGHKKELRECVEKLQVLKTPEERQRKLNEIPEVHADPKMNPNYESEEDTRENDKKRDGVLKRGHSNLSIIGTQLLRPKKSAKEEDNNVQRVEKKSNGGGPNCFQRQENHAASSFGNSSSICSNQSLLRSDSERAITPPVSQSSSLAINIQTEKIWHYRDPNGKIQGPFSMVQLQKWSTTGYFPVNMSIWTVNEQHYSISLNDALSGQFHKNIELYHSIFSEPRVAAGIVTDTSICVDDSLKNLGSDTRNNNATAQVGSDSRTSDRIAEPIHNEKQPVNVPCSDLPKIVTNEVNDADKTEHLPVAPQQYSPVSSGQNRPPVLNLDLNSGDCNVVASVMNTKVDLDLVELPSPTPKSEIKDLKSQPNEQDSVFMDIQAAEMLRSLSARVPSTNGMTVSDVRTSTPNPTDEDPPLPSPKPNPIDFENLPNPEPPTELTDENHLGQSSGPPEISLKDLGWTISISGQDSAEPSCKEWDFGLVPMLKPSDGVDASDSNASRHLDDNLPFHPLPNMSSWPHEPIEFSTLAEESVSDLLAEVDAMESQIGMPPSPSSAMRCGDGNDCFSSIEELSPNTDASKSDAVSFPSQQAEIDQHSIGASQIDGFDPVKRTDLHPSTSTEGEAKSGNYPINIWENRSDIHPPMNQAMINAAGHNWASVQGNMNMGWAGPPPQAFADVGWRPPLNTTWANPNLSLGSFNGNPGWDNNLHRFNGSRDWQFQGGGGGGGGGGGDLGFGRGGGGRPVWGGRQQHNGGGGGGGGGSGGSYSRPMPKGPRVCKFYESGHCKKGASCGYLHP